MESRKRNSMRAALIISVMSIGLVSNLVEPSRIVRAEPVTIIRDNGDSERRVDIVILGDGYTSTQMTKYQNDVEQLTQALFSQQPFAEYQHYFNVRRVDVVSQQSGADHPPSVFKDTALDASYGCGGADQCICVNQSKVCDVLTRSLPQLTKYDIIFILVNDPQLGGCGVSDTCGNGVRIATSYTPRDGSGNLLPTSAADIMAHELGHSFGLLGDEYDYGTCVTGEPSEPNLTTATDRNSIKWKQWIDASTPVPTTTTYACGQVRVGDVTTSCDPARDFPGTNLDQTITITYAAGDQVILHAGNVDDHESLYVNGTPFQFINVLPHSYQLDYGLSTYEVLNPYLHPGTNTIRMTQQNDAGPWAYGFILTKNVSPGVPGLYDGAKYCFYGIGRPTDDSKMRDLPRPFDPINTEQLVKRTYTYVPPIDNSSPASSSVSVPSGSQTFTVTPQTPSTHSLTSTWMLDGTQVATGTSYVLNANQVSSGVHTLQAIVKDLTTMVRSDPNQMLIGTRTWSVTVGTCGSGGTGLRGEYFSNLSLSGSPALIRTDPTVEFTWGGGSPDPTIPVDQFSVRWTGQIQPAFSETYTFYSFNDDGARLWVNGQLLLDRWFDQYGPETASTPIFLTAGQKYDIKVEFYENCCGAEIHLKWSSPSTPKQAIQQCQLFPPTSTGSGTGLTGEYFTNMALSGSPALTRTDPTVDFTWGGGSPDATIPVDHFSVRWTGQIQAQFSETYTFYSFSDDGARLWVNGQLLLDRWFDQYGPETASTPIALTAGQKYDIKVEFFENCCGAEIHLKWSSPSTAKQTIPQSQLFPPASTGGTGLKGDYFTNMVLSGSPALTRTDATVEFTWGVGSPAPAIPVDQFSVRWTGQVQAQFSQTYTFYSFSDDGVRLWVNSQLLLDRWFDQYGPEVASTPISLTAGQKYDIRVEFYENCCGAELHLKWSSPSTPKQTIPQTRLFPAP